MEKLNGLDLFSGIGGITKALEEWVRPISYCENDRHSQGVLLSRMACGDLPVSPIWDDVRTLRGACLPINVDVIYGGFPCQDISCAGTGKGLEGKRSGLFFEIERLVREIQPRFVFLENVPAIRTRGADVVSGRLAGAGYNCRWITLPVPHECPIKEGKRWFCLAKTNGARLEGIHTKGREKHLQPTGTSRKKWETEPNVARVALGIPFGVDRLRALGNSVVPAQAKEAFKILIGIKTGGSL